jgi:lysyl-tRNA synthetase class 1
MESNAWPFAEARKVLKRLGGKAPEQGFVLFETGYGPSGLPHIGTFGEVARTTMVRKAFEVLSDIPTKLIAFSDDMDGLRRVPDNIPNQDMVAKFLELPLTAIPDPFEEYDSFGAHNNARLMAFLDTFGFSYEFVSATECYKAGRFDDVKMKVLEHYDAIMGVILPTLGEERRATYSPFLPICPWTGRVLPGRRQPDLRGQGARRRLQAAMEGRLGHALGRSRRRLRDVGQGPDRFRDPVIEDLPHPGGHAARGHDL